MDALTATLYLVLLAGLASNLLWPGIRGRRK